MTMTQTKYRPDVKQDRIDTGKQIRVINEEGVQIGVLKYFEAQNLAKSKNLDLIPINEKSDIHIYKLGDLNKFKYEQQKKLKEQARKQRENRIELKELKLRPSTDKNDLDRIVKRAIEFLDENDKVKINMVFRGREISQKDKFIEPLTELISRISNGVIEGRIQITYKEIFCILNPVKKD